MPTTISGEVEGKNATVLNPLAVSLAGGPFLTLVDEPDANTTYVGKAVSGTLTAAASWQVRKILVAGNITTISSADGNLLFDNVWDNRAALTYS